MDRPAFHKVETDAQRSCANCACKSTLPRLIWQCGGGKVVYHVKSYEMPPEEYVCSGWWVVSRSNQKLARCAKKRKRGK